MVFESIVVEIINRYLGTFVENLDTSQLKIGIWGGDVVLNKLNLKESALDDLDLPVKIKAGHIGKLTLKIPWKSLYTEPVIAQIDGIYALALPNVGIKYNEEKEKKAEQDAKQAALAKIEERKKWEAEKDNPRDPKQDSFVEKLATQVIKNLQVKVSNIHVRYEDIYTNPARPFALGVTLQELLFQTTDSNWKETVIKEAVTQIYKLVRLDSLSVYWNSKSQMLHEQDKEVVLEEMRDCIQKTLSESVPKQGHKPNLQYLIRPISAVAHLRLNTKPELTDFSIPKIFLTLVFDEIALALSKDQYDDVLEMLESMERMNLLGKYKKTRPSVPYKGNAKEWWHHAYAATLEHTVRRRREMWNWNRIKKHRDDTKQYREIYTKKLDGKKLGGKEQETIKNLEKDLDVFNITMCRQRAELDASRLGKKRADEKSQGGGWLGGWFGGGKKKKKDSTSSPETEKGKAAEELGNKFQEEFTAEEKAKLYGAIGYDENAKDPTLPPEFVAVRLVTKLNKVSVGIIDTRKPDAQLMKLVLTEICASFGQRPAANAIRLDVKVDRFRVSGSPRKDYIPKLISSVGVSKDENISLVTLMVETNPQDGQCDSRIRVDTRPLEITYDAITVNGLGAFFKPPESVRLKQLSNAAMAKYDQIKEQTTAGVAHMMTERKYADIQVNLMPSYIIVPETGEMKPNVNMLLLNLGTLSVSSEKTKEMVQGTQYSPEELAEYAYDKFNIKLEDVQLLLVRPGENWQDAPTGSHLYILRPLSLNLMLEKCMFANDPNLPVIRVGGELPLVAVTISDSKLLAIMKLAQSIPLPEGGPEAPEPEIEEPVISVAALKAREAEFKLGPEKEKTSEYVNLTQAAVKFEIKEITVEINETKQGKETPFLKLLVTRIGVALQAHTFDLTVGAYLGGVYLQHLQYKMSEGIRNQLQKCAVVTGELTNIINSPSADENDTLLKVKMVQADKNGPEFKTTYNNVVQSIVVEFSALDVVLHQSVILSLLEFAKIFEQPSQAPPSAAPSKSIQSASTNVAATSSKSSEATTVGRKKVPADLLLMKLKALVDNIQLSICNDKCVIMHSKIEGIDVGTTIQADRLGVTASMRKIELIDPDPRTRYSEILAVSGSDMFKFEMVQFNNGTEGALFDNVDNVDLKISLQLGRTRIVFVNKFVMSLVNFLDNFNVAKAKLEEASAAMKEASKDVAKNLQEKAPRIKLDVKVKAPLVLIPLNSQSMEAIIMNLGDINVQNKFENITTGQAQPGMAHIAERMTVMLTNLTFSRGILHDDGNVKSDIAILDPMTFKVNISRNLSTGWFHGIPDVEVSGVLDNISVKINQEDVRFAMMLTTENIEERNPDGPQPPKATLIIPTDNPSMKDAATAVSSLEEVPTLKKPVAVAAPEEVYSTLKLRFTLEVVSVELYRGVVNLEAPAPVRAADKMLTQLSLNTLGLTFEMKNNQSMGAQVFLDDFMMDDCRAEKAGGITKLIRKTAAAKEVPKFMSTSREPPKRVEDEKVVDVSFDQNEKQDKVAKLHICSLHICVCVEFLMKVAQFFTDAIPKTEEEEEKEEVSLAQAVHEKKMASASPSKQEPPAPQQGSLDITIQLEKPEIYLIEDQMNLNTDSLIVDVELSIRLRQTPDVLSINGEIKDLSLVSCVFSKSDSKQSVLTPVNITVIGSGPEGKDHHVDVSMSDFIMTITPSTIRLLTAIAAGLSVPPEEASVQPKPKNYSDIWQKRTLDTCKFWFTHSVVDIGSSVDNPDLMLADMDLSASRGELLIVSAPVIVLKLEGGVGHRTVPLLIVESSFSSQIHNWSSDLYIESTLSVEVAYNNEKIGVWEPILEPVMDTSKSIPHKWELSVEVMKADESALTEEDEAILPPPKMTINVMATEPLQILMTKTCLDVLTNLGKAFSEAYQLQDMEGSLGVKIVPYVFKNSSGKELSLKLDASFELSSESAGFNLEAIQTGQEIFMNVKTKKVLVTQNSVIRSTQHTEEKKINFQMKDSKKKVETSIKQAKKRMYDMTDYKMVVNIESHIGQKVVSFVSLLEVKNHMLIPIEVMYHDSTGMLSAGTVLPEKTLSVPLPAVYCSTGEIFFQPITDNDCFSLSKECIKWKTLTEATKLKQISCETKAPRTGPTYFFNVLPKFEKIFHENTDDKTENMITLHLHPTVILHNLLPFPITYSLENSAEQNPLEAGHNVALDNASVNHTNIELQIANYRGLQWKGKKLIKLDVPELSVWTFEAKDNGKSLYMDLGLHSKEKQGSFDISVYSPYWIVNMSEQDLALKEDDKEAPLTQEKDNKGIMLFYFRDKPMFGSSTKRKESTSEKKKEKAKEVKKPGKVMLRIGQAEWSDKFSLDTVGSSGNVSCKDKTAGSTMEVGVNIALASSGLTKIVTFTPYYIMTNASTIPIQVGEEGRVDEWTTIVPGECKGYYPQSSAKEMKIVAKVADTDKATVPFFLNKAHTTLLRLDNSWGGINAECQVSDNAMVTTFTTYKPGMATVQFVNHTTQCTVSVKQSASSVNAEPLTLEPQTAVLYTWTDPTAAREIVWSCGQKKNAKSALGQDHLDEFFAADDVKVYFVSFLDGMQRVVMFTQDLALATVAQEAGELEQADQEINLKIHDMGFSLINNEKMLELAYMGITSSGVIWEEKKKRYKAMKLKDVATLEHAYQKYLMEIAAGKAKKNSIQMLENKLEVDFDGMRMLKPRQCTIRRSFEDGVWVQMRKSPHSMQFHAKINRLQFDDQLRHAVFPTILSPLPPPKSVAADSVPKPFVEVSLMTRIHEHSSLVQVKYFKVLIQEMNLKVDQGFLNEILAMFASDVDTLREQEVVDFKKDVQSTQRELKEEAGVSLQAQRVSFYDYFHVSPIKVHVSFSLQGGSMSDTPQANIMGVFLQSVGVVLTDVQDVVFKLGYFERNHSFYNNSQLTSEFIRHYSGQAVKQMYVLVLGLDVLGNPFGLLRGLSEGIEDLFYEPYQGAIQGPEEFAEGLALGVRSLFGHAVGGAAGAVSRITGTLGKGLAALTLDDDYQKKRREQLNKRPATAREGFARGGKGLVMGVFDGVTGIVRKPVEGAKQEGVAGFFKGMGKGLVGVVTRPTSGVVDFASSSLEGIRRITDFTEEIHRLRPPRRFNRDGVVRPYIREEAEGYNLLLETDKGKYVESDEYITHVKVKEDGKIVFIVTDKRLMLAKRGEIFGAWDTEWMFLYQEIKGTPKQSSKGIEIHLKEREKKKLFSSNVVKKEVPIADAAVAASIIEKIAEAMQTEGVESGL